MLTREALVAAGVGPFVEGLVVVSETGSTNDDLVAVARAGGSHPSALVADAQRAGRGRLGRSWRSPAGCNVYLSVLLHPSGGLGHFPPLALVAGVAVAEALEAVAGVKPELKWPNDVLIRGRKVCGILAEAVDRAPPPLVVGVGLNVNQSSFPGDLAESATSLLLETGREQDRTILTAAVLRRLAARFEDVGSNGLAPILEAWSARSWSLGRRVEAGPVTGLARAIDADGALLVEDDEGCVHRIVA